MLESVSGSPAYRPTSRLVIADAQDLAERAEHLQQVLGAVLDCVGAIVADTSQVAPGGSIDRKYLLGLTSDLAGDVAGSIANAADDLAAGGLMTAITPRESDARIIMGQERPLWIHLRSRTPGPPPFLSMNSWPARLASVANDSRATTHHHHFGDAPGWALVRRCGVELGKRDFMGTPPGW